MTLDPLRRYWSGRGPLERILLLSGIACTGAILSILVLVEPTVSAIVSLQRELPETRARLGRLETLLTEVRALKSRPTATLAADAPAALEQSLAEAGLKAVRIVPLAGGALQLTFADVPYAAWSVWLAAAEPRLGMRTIGVAAKATPTPGNVDVQLELRAGRE